MAANRSHARRQLDARFARLRPLAGEVPPRSGWIRAIRDALGMSGAELASRIGVVQQTIPELERSEMHQTVKLATLRRAAEAMDCDLVYFLVPRTSLQQAVDNQARRRAAAHLAPIAHHSRLEAQSLEATHSAAQLDELAAQFVDRRGLWSETGW